MLYIHLLVLNDLVTNAYVEAFGSPFLWKTPEQFGHFENVARHSTGSRE